MVNDSLGKVQARGSRAVAVGEGARSDAEYTCRRKGSKASKHTCGGYEVGSFVNVNVNDFDSPAIVLVDVWELDLGEPDARSRYEAVVN
ncbi:hypothetical protein ACLOJK_026094 [Asimina triloba]